MDVKSTGRGKSKNGRDGGVRSVETDGKAGSGGWPRTHGEAEAWTGRGVDEPKEDCLAGLFLTFFLNDRGRGSPSARSVANCRWVAVGAGTPGRSGRRISSRGAEVSPKLEHFPVTSKETGRRKESVRVRATRGLGEEFDTDARRHPKTLEDTSPSHPRHSPQSSGSPSKIPWILATLQLHSRVSTSHPSCEAAVRLDAWGRSPAPRPSFPDLDPPRPSFPSSLYPHPSSDSQPPPSRSLVQFPSPRPRPTHRRQAAHHRQRGTPLATPEFSRGAQTSDQARLVVPLLELERGRAGWGSVAWRMDGRGRRQGRARAVRARR